MLETGKNIGSKPSFSFIIGEQQVEEPFKRDFVWGTPARNNDIVPLFQEAVEGMRVGEARRVSIPPSSSFAMVEDATVQVELELVGIKTGLDAAVYQLGQLWRTLNIGPYLILTLFVLFNSDLKRLFGGM